MPPSQLKVPTEPDSPSHRVTTDRQKPHPRVSKNPGTSPETALFAGVSWSVVISSTDGRDRMRVVPSVPPPRSIRAKVRKSTAVETRPAPPDRNGGLVLHCPPAAGSYTSRRPLAGSVQ